MLPSSISISLTQSPVFMEIIYEDTKINTKWIAKTCVKTRQITPCSKLVRRRLRQHRRLLYFHFRPLTRLYRMCISTYIYRQCERARDNVQRVFLCLIIYSLIRRYTPQETYDIGSEETRRQFEAFLNWKIGYNYKFIRRWMINARDV